MIFKPSNFGPSFALFPSSEGRPYTVGGNHQEVEAVWRERWEKAKTNLELATIHFHEIERMANIHEADYQRSLQALTAAVAEYSKVLRIYTDLKACGKIPDDVS